MEEKIGPKAMEQIRTRAVKLVQQGHSPEEVIATLGFSRACIYNWLARYRAGGVGCPENRKTIWPSQET